MEEQTRTVPWWHGLPLGVRVLVGLLAFRLLAWAAGVAAALHFSLTEPAELSALIWTLVGTASPVPASLDGPGIGKLAVIVGGSFVFHIIVLLTLAVRSRWVANLFLTVWVVAIIVSDNPGIDGVLFVPVWLLLISPPTQRFLDRAESDDGVPGPAARPLSWAERASVCGHALLSGLLPGLGQLFHQRWRRGAAIFVAWAITWVTHLEPGWTLISLFALSDAGWMTAMALRARRPDVGAGAGQRKG